MDGWGARLQSQKMEESTTGSRGSRDKAPRRRATQRRRQLGNSEFESSTSGRRAEIRWESERKRCAPRRPLRSVAAQRAGYTAGEVGAIARLILRVFRFVRLFVISLMSACLVTIGHSWLYAPERSVGDDETYRLHTPYGYTHQLPYSAGFSRAIVRTVSVLYMRWKF